jgi:hypothetical protein
MLENSQQAELDLVEARHRREHAALKTLADLRIKIHASQRSTPEFVKSGKSLDLSDGKFAQIKRYASMAALADTIEVIDLSDNNLQQGSFLVTNRYH